MSRIFLSHSSRDNRPAVAVKAWLIEQEPGLADEIFLDLDPHTVFGRASGGGRRCSRPMPAARR